MHQVKLNMYEPNCTKAEQRIVTAMAVLQHSTYKNNGTQGYHLRVIAEAKIHHCHGLGMVPTR
jgi:hypothetical protein